MKNQTKITLTIILTIIYNYFFWMETWGINILLFTLLIAGVQFILYKESFRSARTLTALAGTVISAMLVCIHGSDTSKFACIISFFVLTGFIHQPGLRTVYRAIYTALASVLKAPLNYADIIRGSQKRQVGFSNSMSYLKLGIIPLIVLTIFYWIYKFANPVFYKASSRFWNYLGDQFGHIFQNISFSWLLFIISGALIIAGMIFNRNILRFLNSDLSRSDELKREKRKSKNTYKASTIALRNEYRTGLLIIISVNILLLVVNVIDINWIWFNFIPEEIPNMAMLVHEGTYLLILSIILSMLLLLYFFRRNLNFYKNNNLLKTAAYLWIVQNFILAISVAIRNYHYITHYGIAYKRIGVIIFLLLTISGLLTMYLKIKRKYSTYYLFRVNSWAVYIMMILISFVNWDRTIASFNLHHPERQNIDILFVLQLSDKTLDIVNENRIFFDDPLIYKFNRYYHSKEEANKQINERIRIFMEEYPKRSWLSWNLSEHNTYRKLLRNIHKQ